MLKMRTLACGCAGESNILKGNILHDVCSATLLNPLCYFACPLHACLHRLAPTCEWDTAAADIIVREAGGVVLQAGKVTGKGELLEKWQVRRIRRG